MTSADEQVDAEADEDRALDEPAPRRRPWVRRRFLVGAVAALVVAVLVVPLPFLFIIGPGSAVPVEDRVRLERTPEPLDTVSGDLLLLTVSLRQPTAPESLVGWLDDNKDVVWKRRVVPEGIDEEEYLRAQRRLFQESGEVAAAVGLRAADVPGVRVGGGGARVVDVFPGTPADGKLRSGDVVVAVDGQPIELASDLTSTLSKRASGDEVTLGLRRGGDDTEVRVRLGRVARLDRPGLGVAVETLSPEVSLPVDMELEQGDIGGPSAGLMIALTVYDLIDPGDLSAGRSIAGTGTIDINGEVGPVGGVRQKIEAARAADAKLFLAPAEEVAEARAAAGPDLPVVAVRTFDDALRALQQPAR